MGKPDWAQLTERSGTCGHHHQQRRRSSQEVEMVQFFFDSNQKSFEWPGSEAESFEVRPGASQVPPRLPGASQSVLKIGPS